MRIKVKHIVSHYKCPPDKAAAAIEMVLKQAEVLSGDWTSKRGSGRLLERCATTLYRAYFNAPIYTENCLALGHASPRELTPRGVPHD
jgi:hypothetical protein